MLTRTDVYDAFADFERNRARRTTNERVSKLGQAVAVHMANATSWVRAARHHDAARGKRNDALIEAAEAHEKAAQCFERAADVVRQLEREIFPMDGDRSPSMPAP